MDPGERQGQRDRPRPLRCRERRERVAVRDRQCRSAEHPANLLLIESREPCRAERKQERVRQPPIRVVGREQDLLRRHLAHQVEKVDDAPHRGVEEDAGHVSEVACEAAEIGDAGMGDDQANALVPVDERREVVADRR